MSLQLLNVFAKMLVIGEMVMFFGACLSIAWDLVAHTVGMMMHALPGLARYGHAVYQCVGAILRLIWPMTLLVGILLSFVTHTAQSIRPARPPSSPSLPGGPCHDFAAELDAVAAFRSNGEALSELDPPLATASQQYHANFLTLYSIRVGLEGRACEVTGWVRAARGDGRDMHSVRRHTEEVFAGLAADKLTCLRVAGASSQYASDVLKAAERLQQEVASARDGWGTLPRVGVFRGAAAVVARATDASLAAASERIEEMVRSLGVLQGDLQDVDAFCRLRTLSGLEEEWREAQSAFESGATEDGRRKLRNLEEACRGLPCKAKIA